MRALLVAALLLGCDPVVLPEPWEYSHTVSNLPEGDACLSLVTTCDDVTLLCEGERDFADRCDDVRARSTDVYALPGARSAPNRPFGVATCVSLEGCE